MVCCHVPAGNAAVEIFSDSSTAIAAPSIKPNTAGGGVAIAYNTPSRHKLLHFPPLLHSQLSAELSISSRVRLRA